ncbi:hypothetical protein BpHYR1_022749 [Brachionus plicatilis]|uniref:SWIM-type domain-containing protein n=1 Tax=Brachionus plicatilis TaxID=10195 RepID=A0A3M7TBZ9_BRAPC|nr:hypothetical protein BpHYR1_022749 [Brachionus plicatilis]
MTTVGHQMSDIELVTFFVTYSYLQFIKTNVFFAKIHNAKPNSKMKFSTKEQNKNGATFKVASTAKPFQHINDVYMVKSGKKSDFTRDEGKQYLSDLESKTWTTFDEMISSLNSIRIVKVNRENWKLSSCTCSYWLKNYYCCHSIACCYRLKLMNFNDIGMDIPLNYKPKRGAKKKTRSCLQHQPFDCIQNEENAILESDQDSDIESEPTPKSSKKQKPNDAVLSIENICKTCNAAMKKKRVFFY